MARGKAAIFDSMILPCGKFTAPDTCPRAHIAGLRTSRRTQSASLDMASCTSQQSVSKDKQLSKCAAATALSAGGICLTELGMLDVLGLTRCRYAAAQVRRRTVA